MHEPATGISWRDEGQGLGDGRIQGIAGSGFGLRQEDFDFAPTRLDRRQIGQVRGQIPQAGLAPCTALLLTLTDFWLVRQCEAAPVLRSQVAHGAALSRR